MEYRELIGSPSETYCTGGEKTATRKVACSWNERYKLAQILADSSYPYNLELVQNGPITIEALDPDDPYQREEAFGGETAVLTVNYATKEPKPWPS